MLISLSLVMRKACFRVRYRALTKARVGPEGGATYQWRLNGETRRKSQLASAAGKRQAILTQIGGFSPPRV